MTGDSRDEGRNAASPNAASRNDAEVARARAIMPGGVNSPVRAFGAVGGAPRMIASARGAYVTDVDGREYVDLVCGWGSILLGHAHPVVVEAVRAAAARGLSFGASTPGETDLAEAIAARVPPAERVRLVSTGTEAAMTAARLARGATGRDLIIKFSGHYHGHADGFLADAGSGLATLALPASAGVPSAVAAQTLVLPYNDLDAVRAAFAAHPGAIAAVIAEAAAANMGVVPPDPGFNAELARIAHADGALLILDEVLTGFRVGPAGWWGLESSRPRDAGERRAADAPDLMTFGKVIGGGLPVAAVAGRREVMDLLAPSGPVYQAGTLSGNPVAVAAGIATLSLADDDLYARIDAAALAIAAAASAALEAEGVPHVVQRSGNLFSVFMGEAVARGVRDFSGARRQEPWRYAAFFRSMLKDGVSLPPSAFEAWFVSGAHDAAAVDRVLSALPRAARAAASATMSE